MHLVDPFFFVFFCFVLNHLNYFYHDQLAETNLARRHYQTQTDGRTDGRQLSDNSLHTRTLVLHARKRYSINLHSTLTLTNGRLTARSLWSNFHRPIKKKSITDPVLEIDPLWCHKGPFATTSWPLCSWALWNASKGSMEGQLHLIGSNFFFFFFFCRRL